MAISVGVRPTAFDQTILILHPYLNRARRLAWGGERTRSSVLRKPEFCTADAIKTTRENAEKSGMSYVLTWLIATAAHAGFNGAVRSSPFAICRGRHQVTRPFPARCRPTEEEQLAAAAADIAKAQQLGLANQIARRKIEEQLDLFIDSRTKLLVCMDQDTAECRERVNALTTMLTTQAKRLRVLLALSSSPPEGLDERTIDRTPQDIRLPSGLGGRALPPLSADEKLEVRKAREVLLAKQKYLDGEALPGCRSLDPQDACRRYQQWLFNKKVELHDAAGTVAEVLAHQLPLVTQVDEVPVTKEAARKILRASQDILREWKSEVARDYVDQPDALVHNYPRIYEPILSEHPEYCDGVSAALLHARARGKLKDYAWTAAQAGTTLAGCWFVGGVVCTGIGTGWSAWHLGDRSWKAGVLRERYKSLGGVEGQAEDMTANSLLPYSDVQSAQRDAIVALAGTAVGGTFLARSVNRALDPERLPSRPWSQQLEEAMKPEKLDPARAETLIMKTGRKVEGAVRKNATETLLDRRFHVNGVAKPLGVLEEELAELYSPVP